MCTPTLYKKVWKQCLNPSANIIYFQCPAESWSLVRWVAEEAKGGGSQPLVSREKSIKEPQSLSQVYTELETKQTLGVSRESVIVKASLSPQMGERKEEWRSSLLKHIPPLPAADQILVPLSSTVASKCPPRPSSSTGATGWPPRKGPQTPFPLRLGRSQVMPS
jgi:hypothetical protein